MSGNDLREILLTKSRFLPYLHEDEVGTWHKSLLPTFHHNPRTQIPTKIQYSTESKHHLALSLVSLWKQTIFLDHPQEFQWQPAKVIHPPGSGIPSPLVTTFSLLGGLPPLDSHFPSVVFPLDASKLGQSPKVSSDKHDWLPLSYHWLSTTGFD